MYNFMNKQSEKRGKKLCISVSGCLLIAIVFICLYAFFHVVVYVLIKATVLWSIVSPHFSKNVAYARAPERSLFIRLRYVE